MVRRSISWSLVLAVLVLVGPGLALACTLPAPAPWTKRSQDGRFELSLTGSLKGAARDAQLNLRDRRTGAVVWTTFLGDFVAAEDVLIAPDGAEVLVIQRSRQRFALYGKQGAMIGAWLLETVLSRSELERIFEDPCFGKQWVRSPRVEADGFSLVVPLNASVGSTPQTREITFWISSGGVMGREPGSLNRTPLELIQLYRRVGKPLERLRIAEELWGVAREDRSKGGYEVPRFWLEVLSDPSTPRSVHPIAVEGLGAAGSEADLLALRRLPPGEPERDAHILQVLARRLPEEAGSYAVSVLEQPHPSLHVRAAAIQYLLAAGGTASDLGRTFLQREEVLRQTFGLAFVEGELEVLEDFWQLLPFCEHPSAQMQAATTRRLAHLVRASAPMSMILIDLPASAETTLRNGCPEVLVILGAVAEKTKDTELALRLYGFGVAGLEELPAEQRQRVNAVLLEGKLRLAALAKEAKDWSELGRLTQEVLAAPSRSTLVCGLSAALYAQDSNPADCAKLRPAEAVARKLLQEARAQGMTSSEPSPASD